jgi:predicted nucleotidyltransferase
MKISPEILDNPKYEFLKTDPHLKGHIILLGVGGSYSYGTNVPDSDVDVRGIAKNTRDCLLGIDQFEQRENKVTDTVVYSLNKAVSLLSNCNPNMIELLGLNPEHYLYMDEDGNTLIQNADMFFSKKAIASFGGYATSQLYRIRNAMKNMKDDYKEDYILHSILGAVESFNNRYKPTTGVTIRMGKDHKLQVDMEMKDYPLRDARGMLSEMTTILQNYDKCFKEGTLNHRNRKQDDAHMNKHAMHLVRLLLTGTQLLEEKRIVTYRKAEHDMLMDIRNGKYMDNNHELIPAFYDLVASLEAKFKYASDNTELPDKPDYNRIREYLCQINRWTVISG